MSENIFENAKFGDAYKTRDGRKAIYLGLRDAGRKAFMLYNVSTTDWFIEDHKDVDIYTGKVYTTLESCSDIISKWNEQLDTEKLCQLAEEMNPYTKLKYPTDEEFGSIWGYNIGFINGYRKAEEKLL